MAIGTGSSGPPLPLGAASGTDLAPVEPFTTEAGIAVQSVRKVKIVNEHFVFHGVAADGSRVMLPVTAETLEAAQAHAARKGAGAWRPDPTPVAEG